MTNNIQLGPDAEINQLIRILKAQSPGGGIPCETPISPGVRFSFDPEAQFQGHLRPEVEGLLSFRVEKIEETGWFALHVMLGGADLSDYSVIGFVCKSDAPSSLALKTCIRSGTESGFVDCFFEKHVVAYAETSVHLDVIDLSRKPDFPQQAPWRDFVMFFPNDKPTDLTLRDLRFFIV